MVRGEKGRDSGDGGECVEHCNAGDGISGTTFGPAVWRCVPLPQPW